jgi:DNA-directed RNA polymerase specialized sigma24 family protein
VREIAAILGLTEGYVDLVVRRALLKLRDNPMVRELSGEDPGPTYQEGFGED